MKENKLVLVKKILFSKFDILIFLITFGVLLISLLAFYPGIMTSDSLSQWEQINKNEYSAWHPIFHTLFERLLTFMWNSPAIIALFQSLVFSLILTIIFKYSRGQENRFWILIIQVITSICVFIIPVNYIYPITLWKDIMYSFSLFSLLVYIYKLINNSSKIISLKDKIGIAICLACITLFRYNGIIVVLFTFITMLIYNLIIKNIKDYFKLVGIFFIALIILKIPTYLVNTVEGSQRYKSGVFIHMTGALLKENKINNEQDLQFLDTLYDIDKWIENYNPYTHDGIMFSKEVRENDKYISENSDKLKNIVIKYSLKNPKVILKHYFYLTAMTWKIRPFENTNYYSFVNLTNSQSLEDYPSTIPQSILPNIKHYAEKYNDWINSNKLLSTLFYRPALHMYLSIILVLILIGINKNKKYLFLLIPMIGNTLSMIPAMPAQDFRYFYINLLTLIAIVIIFTSEIVKMCYNKKNFRNVLLFLIFITLINIFSYIVCIKVFSINNIISNFISWLISIGVAFGIIKFFLISKKK